jgi:hypothetical protein
MQIKKKVPLSFFKIQDTSGAHVSLISGAWAAVTSSISKNSAWTNLKMEEMILEGKTSIRVLKSLTLPL